MLTSRTHGLAFTGKRSSSRCSHTPVRSQHWIWSPLHSSICTSSSASSATPRPHPQHCCRPHEHWQGGPNLYHGYECLYSPQQGSTLLKQYTNSIQSVDHCQIMRLSCVLLYIQRRSFVTLESPIHTSGAALQHF